MRRFLAVSSCVVLVVACSLQGEPDRTSPYPTQPITLVTDDLGITHVYAQNDPDAFFGAGYTMARDRLFQMDLARRQADGTLSEVFGASKLQDDIASRTFDFARLGAADWARLQQESPDEAKLVDAWVDGVNKRIHEVEAGTALRPYGLGPGELNYVPAPFTAQDGFAIAKALAFGNSNTLDAELLATLLGNLAPDMVAKVPILQPAYDAFPMVDQTKPAPVPKPPPAPPIVTPSAPLDVARLLRPPPWPARHFASNNWAVSGAFTDTGMPYVCGDPHQAYTEPTRLYPLAMSSTAGGGTLDVIGFAFTGTPTVEIGHNAHVGWTATTNFADVMDLWDVTVDPDMAHVTLGDGAHDVVTRTETIRVRDDGYPVAAGHDETVDLYDVPGYGVLLPDSILPVPHSFLVKGNAILFDWTGFRATREFSAFLGLDRAKDVAGVEAADTFLDVGANNFVAADQKSIVYDVHAAIPDRGTPGTHPMPYRVVPGSDAATLWTRGDLGQAALPRIVDPPKGFLATANTDPWGFTADGNVDNDPFYYGSFFASGFRLQRIEDDLTAMTASPSKITRQDMETMQLDEHSVLADTLLPPLADAVAAIGTEPDLAAYASRDDLKSLAAALGAWDHVMDKDRGEPVVFLAMEWFAVKRVFEQLATPNVYAAINDASAAYFLALLRNVVTGRFAGSDQLLPQGGVHALLMASLDDAATWLQSKFGSLDPTTFKLGDVQAARFSSLYGNRLDVAPTPKGGGPDTIDVAGAPFFDKDTVRDAFYAGDGPLYRMVIGFDPDGTPRATLDFTQGTSENPDDKHFSDQQDHWAKGEHMLMPFTKADVDAHTELTLTIPAAVH